MDGIATHGNAGRVIRGAVSNHEQLHSEEHYRAVFYQRDFTWPGIKVSISSTSLLILPHTDWYPSLCFMVSTERS